MNFDQFITKYSGKKIDFDGAYQGQCVDLYRQYVKEVLTFPQSPGVIGAAEIYETASTEYYEKIKNTPTGVPQKGDVVIWNKKAGGGFGHVAVFIEGNTTRFSSFDQNWRALNVCEKTEHNYTNVTGWLRPRKGVMASELEVCMADRLKFWGERDAALARIKDLEASLAQKPTEVIKEVVVTKEVPVEIIKEVIVTQPTDTLGALQLITLAVRSIVAGKW